MSAPWLPFPIRLKLLIQAVIVVGFLIPLAIALASLSGWGHRWVDILAQFTAPTLSVTILALLATLIARLWRAAAFGGGVCILLFLAVWPQVWPNGSPPTDAEGPRLRVYAANLYAMNDDVAAMRSSIAAAQADILVLVEFGDAPMQAIDQILEGYPHRHVTEPVVRTQDTVRSVIASRHPLSPRPTDGHERQMISAVADTPLGAIRVVGVHLTRPWPFQFQWGQIIQSQRLIEHVRGAAEPVILAGDFNSVAAGRIGRMLRSEGSLTHASGWPGTWPSALPGPLRITIDHVYHSPGVTASSRRLGRPTGSDHRPVIVEFAAAENVISP